MATQHILQVSELTKKVKFMLESELNTVWLCGEISNFVAASSGHWYLSLKDSKSQVRCAMFKGNNRRVRLAGGSAPRNGQQVLVRAKVSLYEPRGDFQLIIEMMEDAGEGLLRQQFEQLKSKLNAQGLFGQQFKQEIPRNICTVGIVTSPTGAAVKDIISVLQRRNPSIDIVIYPALVQGQQAKDDIVHAIDSANQREECQVLIVGRGGGSLEDLWSFNDEQLARTIFASQIPVISAVGHEVDFTIADFVADVRAPTPSAAAELLSPDQQEFWQRLSTLSSRLIKSIEQQVKNKQWQLQSAQRGLQHPGDKLSQYAQTLDMLEMRMRQSQHVNLDKLKQRLLMGQQKLQQHSPSNKLQQIETQLGYLQKRLSNGIKQVLTHKSEQLQQQALILNAVSPLQTLGRGYAILQTTDNTVVRDSHEVKRGDVLSAQIGSGQLTLSVEKIKHSGKKK